MAARAKHPNKEVEAAIAYAESRGWVLRKQGHWGRLYCPRSDRDGCQVGVWGTPKNAETHARQVRQAVNRCPHQEPETTDGDV